MRGRPVPVDNDGFVERYIYVDFRLLDPHLTNEEYVVQLIDIRRLMYHLS